MSRAIVFRISFVLALFVALAGMPQSSFAQRGGHGGGGFHGGGGGFHGGNFGGHSGSGFRGSGGSFHGGGGGFHNPGSFGDFHGGGFNGFHGGHGFDGFRGGRGFGGFRGDRFFGGYGFPGYGYGLSFGFGFWPYWDAYPYYYGYNPWWAAPYSYYPPYYGYDPYDRYDDDDHYYRRDHQCRPDYRHPDNGCDDASPDRNRRREDAPARPSNTAVPEGSPNLNYVTNNVEDYSRADSNASIARSTGITANYQLAYSTTKQFPSTRPAVRNAIQTLRAMPPDAQQRQLNSGRYDGFSPEERELLNNALKQAE